MKSEATEKELLIEEKIVLHRLPYMKMKKSISTLVNRIMFILIFAMSIQVGVIEHLNSILSTLMAGFNIFIFPGFFYYKANKERYVSESLDDRCERILVEKAIEKESLTKDLKAESKASSMKSDSLFNQTSLRSKELESHYSCHENRVFWSFHRKALFGQIWMLFGVLVTLSLTTVMTYMITISSNNCLFYYYHPPCEDS